MVDVRWSGQRRSTALLPTRCQTYLSGLRHADTNRDQIGSSQALPVKDQWVALVAHDTMKHY